jgi:hypothetical protein
MFLACMELLLTVWVILAPAFYDDESESYVPGRKTCLHRGPFHRHIRLEELRHVTRY